eukprot:GHVR01182572.1.p1 GENE.GHVR01182572.1~~GHVR01182572.1.p1  ORF type:complete len:100 (-),score=2.73 GHVR01182572.1:132-431(-)
MLPGPCHGTDKFPGSGKWSTGIPAHLQPLLSAVSRFLFFSVLLLLALPLSFLLVQLWPYGWLLRLQDLGGSLLPAAVALALSASACLTLSWSRNSLSSA